MRFAAALVDLAIVLLVSIGLIYLIYGNKGHDKATNTYVVKVKRSKQRGG